MSLPAPESREIIEALLRQRTRVAFRAHGPSMNPTIRDGETVFVRPADANAFHIGSVVLYRTADRLALHRIVFNDKRTKRLFLVGDASIAGGEWIPAADVIGLAESLRRNDAVRRLDAFGRRLAGRLRFALRPLRRALWNFRQTHHAQTPDRWWS